MNIGLYQSAASLKGLERWQNATAQNIAWSPAAGYKQVGISVSGVSMGETPSVTGTRFDQILQNQEPSARAKIDFSAGPLVQTGVETDVALRSEGFFEVAGPNGERVFTRDGQFHVSPDNALVNKNGLPVQGVNGPIELTPGLGELKIDGEGRVFQGQAQINQLAVSNIADPAALVTAGGGFVLPPDSGVEITPIAQPAIAQGAYEGSNVSAIREMVNLIQISRAYEASQKVVTQYDEHYARVNQQLGGQ